MIYIFIEKQFFYILQKNIILPTLSKIKNAILNSKLIYY